VWNALHAGLSDAGVFTGTITTSGTTTLSGPVSITGALSVASASASVFAAPASNAIAARLVGRSADNVAVLDFTNNAQSTQQAAIRADPNGVTFSTGSTARPYTFNDARVNSAAAQPGFLARNTASDTSVSSETTIDFDTEMYDTASNFSGDVFTAPVAGIYQFGGVVTITNATGGAFDVRVALVCSTFGIFDGPMVNAPAGGTVRVSIPSVPVSLIASETVRVVYIGGGAVTIVGSDYVTPPGVVETYFGGRLLL
jgi:hypothetical protein